MKKYLYDYIKEIDTLFAQKKIKHIDDIISNHLIKIQFFQHERLIHLLVTLVYAILLIAMVALTIYYKLLSIVVLIMTTVLVFYVKHYFSLENGVQYLYKQYDMLKEKKNE